MSYECDTKRLLRKLLSVSTIAKTPDIRGVRVDETTVQLSDADARIIAGILNQD